MCKVHPCEITGGLFFLRKGACFVIPFSTAEVQGQCTQNTAPYSFQNFYFGMEMQRNSVLINESR